MPGPVTSQSGPVAISNPHSGRNKTGGFEKFNQVLANYPQICHQVTECEKQLVRALEGCKQARAKLIIVNGGDGTLLQILTYLKSPDNLAYRPELILLRAGTTSMAFGDVGLRGGLKQALGKAVRYARQQPACLQKKNRQVLQMTLPNRNKTLYGMFFGAGVIYNAILYCRQNLHTKGMRGETGPAIAMMRYLFDWLTVNKLTTSSYAQVEIDQSFILSGDYTMISATTLNRLLMGVYPFWGQAHAANHINLSLIKRHAPKAAQAFIKILSGRPPAVESQADYYISRCPARVKLSIQDGFTLDGELFGEQGVTTNVILQPAGHITFLTA